MLKMKDGIYVLITSNDPAEFLTDTDKYLLLKIDGIEGLSNYIGFEQSVDVQNGGIRDYVLNQSVIRQTIPVKLYFRTEFSGGKEISAYSKMHDFMSVFGRYISIENYTMTLILNMGNGNGIYDHPFHGSVDFLDHNENTDPSMFGLRLDFYPKSIKPDGLLKAGTCDVSMDIKALSAFYTSKRIDQFSKSSTAQKVYGFTYPYEYGIKSVIGTDDIVNSYIEDIPVKIELSPAEGRGIVKNPIITLRRPKSIPYSEIVFDDLTINQGEKLIIDSDRFLVYVEKTNASGITEQTNVIDKISKAHASFLWARPGNSVLMVSPEDPQSSDEWTARITYTHFQVC